MTSSTYRRSYITHFECGATASTQKELGMGFVDKFSWPPSSANYLPLHYYFWNAVKQEVYRGRRAPFKDLEELKKKNKQVWRGCSETLTLNGPLFVNRKKSPETGKMTFFEILIVVAHPLIGTKLFCCYPNFISSAV